MNKEELKKNINKKIDEGKKIAKKVAKKIEAKIEEAREKSSHNYFDYLEYYGNYTFEEREFNEIDNVILSMLTYVNYKGIVSDTKKKITLEEASEKFFKKHSRADYLC